MDIIERATRAGQAACTAFRGRHQGRIPNLTTDHGALDLIWPTAWVLLQQQGAAADSEAACYTAFSDGYFDLAPAVYSAE